MDGNNYMAPELVIEYCEEPHCDNCTGSQVAASNKEKEREKEQEAAHVLEKEMKWERQAYART